jgi:hypothetical protein
MLRLWPKIPPAQCMGPGRCLVTMTRDDDLPGAAHPQGRCCP